jgi:hypothetical protein
MNGSSLKSGLHPNDLEIPLFMSSIAFFGLSGTTELLTDRESVGS